MKCEQATNTSEPHTNNKPIIGLPGYLPVTVCTIHAKNQNSDSSMLIGYTLGINHTARFESEYENERMFYNVGPRARGYKTCYQTRTQADSVSTNQHA